MKAKEIRTQTIEKLQQLLREKRIELGELRFQSKVEQLRQNHQVGILKKDIARILMVLSEKSKPARVAKEAGKKNK